MLPNTAQQFKRNALFRLLAFLDNTGVQTFELNSEVDVEGKFRRPDAVFTAEAPITGVLTAALDALRANVRHLFTDADEQQALLSVLGSGASELSVNASQWIVAVPAGVKSKVLSQQQRAPSLPLCPVSLSTPWCEAALHPTSLERYAEDIENEIPIHLLVRLREVLGISDEPSFCCTSSPFIEQFLIDGVDEWLRRCPIEEVKRIILACGVQPTVWASAFTQEAEQKEQQAALPQNTRLPDALVDFVVDVVFPVSETGADELTKVSGSAAAQALQDWLILSYEKNHEALDIEESEEGDADIRGDDGHGNRVPLPGERKRARAGDTRSSVGSSTLGSWEPMDDEEVLTADNIDRYLLECPQRIPKNILREKRKRISDASITEFELNHHYTAAELRKLVREGLGVMKASEATSFMECPVTEAQIEKAALLTRKAEFVEWILSVHKAEAQ